MSTFDDLRAIALTEFAKIGYQGTSLHHVAEVAGVSKSNVLYHFASKEALLEAAIGPAIEQLSDILETMAKLPLTVRSRDEFIVAFVDFLLAHRLEVHIFINQARSLEDVPVVGRANELIVRLAMYFSTSLATTEDTMRFGIALGGAAYTLVSQSALDLTPPPIDEIRAALITIVTELLTPISVLSAPGATTQQE